MNSLHRTMPTAWIACTTQANPLISPHLHTPWKRPTKPAEWSACSQSLTLGWNLVAVVPVPFFNGLCSSRRFHVHELCGSLDKRHDDEQHAVYSVDVMFTDTTAVAWADQSFLPLVPCVEFLATHGPHPLPLKWFTVLASPDDFVPKLMGTGLDPWTCVALCVGLCVCVGRTVNVIWNPGVCGHCCMFACAVHNMCVNISMCVTHSDMFMLKKVWILLCVYTWITEWNHAVLKQDNWQERKKHNML